MLRDDIFFIVEKYGLKAVVDFINKIKQPILGEEDTVNLLGLDLTECYDVLSSDYKSFYTDEVIDLYNKTGGFVTEEEVIKEVGEEPLELEITMYPQTQKYSLNVVLDYKRERLGRE